MTSDISRASPGAPQPAKFVTGPPMRHIAVMTSTSAIGLMAIFLVDLADMYFLSLLGEVEVAAAIGYAGSILFFTTSIGIGLSIATTALVSRSLGGGDVAMARRLATSAYAFAIAVTVLLAIAIWFAVPYLLDMLGARGRAHMLASSYLRIIVPSMPLLAIGMCSGGVLRATGEATRAMYVTLAGGLANAALDPVLIFVAGLGVDGAAIASVASRFVVMGVGLYFTVGQRNLVARFSWPACRRDVRAIAEIAVPAMATNVATPVGNAYVTGAIAAFGDSAVAGWAIIGRLIPVAFGAVFALTGAVGPIIGQNLGAKAFDRVQRTFRDALLFAAGLVLAAWIALAMASGWIIEAFGARGEAASLISLFCVWLAPLFAFFGALFVANAAFNNLGRPHYSTAFNWARATLGTIPFVYLGSQLFGAPGVIAGNLLGAVVFGTAAVLTCYRVIACVMREGGPPASAPAPLQRRVPLWPFSTGRE